MLQDAIDEEPIFLLGTGRCGSTFQQTRLSGVGDVWIWGEHDGMLIKLREWSKSVAASTKLNEFSFSRPLGDPSVLLQKDHRADATIVAWLNGFRTADLDRVLRLALTSLFTCGLPAGKRRWGFKEIRYGPDDRVAEFLLDLFPRAKIVHTLRGPFPTIESGLFAWHFPALQDAFGKSDEAIINSLYSDYAIHWERTARYFLDLEASFPDRVFTSKLETFRENLPKLLTFLNLEEFRQEQAVTNSVVNASLRNGSEYNEFAIGLKGKRTRVADIVGATAARAGYDVAVSLAI